MDRAGSILSGEGQAEIIDYGVPFSGVIAHVAYLAPLYHACMPRKSELLLSRAPIGNNYWQ
jgi:hypothetical protein